MLYIMFFLAKMICYRISYFASSYCWKIQQYVLVQSVTATGLTNIYILFKYGTVNKNITQTILQFIFHWMLLLKVVDSIWYLQSVRFFAHCVFLSIVAPSVNQYILYILIYLHDTFDAPLKSFSFCQTGLNFILFLNILWI